MDGDTTLFVDFGILFIYQKILALLIRLKIAIIE